MNTRILVLAMVACVFAATDELFAAAVPITNPSFESADIADGTFGPTPTGWTLNGVQSGLLDRNSGGFATAIDPTPDATDSEQMIYSNQGDHYQVLTTTLTANTTYTMTADAGDRTDVNFGGGELRLGTGLSFNTNLLTPSLVWNNAVTNGGGASDGWKTWRSTFSTGPTPSGLGDPLRVEVLGSAAQTLFDNVRLESNNYVPVPLQNATADFSQSGYEVDHTIDAILNGNNGWAFAPQTTVPHDGVWETQTDLAQGNLTFVLDHFYTPGDNQAFRKLRFWVTQDNRNDFADGLAIGGDVTANWTQLVPLSATMMNGGVTTINGDNSISFANDDPVGGGTTTSYTVTASAPFGSITGFRLEVLTDSGAVGYAGSNAVLTEFSVYTIPEPSTFALAALGLLGLLGWRRRRRR